MPKRTIRLVRDGFPDRMTLDTAVSQVLLHGAADGVEGETLRLSIPGRAVAFGKHDLVTPGFETAVAASRAAGFAPYLRLAGGRAATFHEQTIALSWTIPDPRPIAGIRTRFDSAADLIVGAMEALGIRGAVGPVPGEYCPGEFSVHVGSKKVAGLGQRLAKTAAHIGGVIVVGDGALVRNVLVPVYEAMGLDWDPATAGALSDTIPSLDPDQVIDTLVAELSRTAEIEPATLPAATVEAAETIAERFAVA